MVTYKPPNYNSLSPYLVVDNAQKLIDLLMIVFGAQEVRRYDRPDGKIGHAELRIDDSIIMLSDSTKDYGATKTLLHLYVPEVLKTFDRAIRPGCTEIQKPVNKPHDPDTRGAFYDPAGNYWAVSTQRNEADFS